MMHLVRALGAEMPKKGNALSQNGVKFRSLCQRCNNERLGRDTDPDLIRICNQVHGLLSTKLILPSRLLVPVRPQRLIRAVVGHLLAYGINRVPKGPFEVAMAQYFLDTSMPTPPGMECFYWVYPYTDQVLARDALLTDSRTPDGDNVLFKLVKFYPLAFFCTWNRPATYGFQFDNLCRFGHLGFDEEAEIPVQLGPLPPRRWPETPTERSLAVIHGAESMYAKPYLPRV
jgi:hypothetical protein